MMKNKRLINHPVFSFLQNNNKDMTKRSTFNHIALIHQIMEQGDPEGVTKLIMNNPEKRRAKNTSRVFYNIRNKIIRNPKYHLPDAITNLRALSDKLEYPASDRIRLKKIIQEVPMHKIHWFQNNKRTFENHDLNAEFKSIKLFRDPFYDFKCPEELFDETRQNDLDDIQDRHMHKHTRKTADNFEFTESQIDAMIETARDFIFAPVDWKFRPNSLRLVECLCLLTGRRKWEIMNTLQIRSVPGFPYQAEIRGIAKSQSSAIQEDDWRRIPLLAPIDEIVQGITQVRQFLHTFGNYSLGKSLFPNNMNHTAFRDIFSSTTYRFRDINKFQDISCSEMGWKKESLLISFQNVCHYSALSFDRNNEQQSPHQSQQQLTDSEMAYPLCGSSDN